MELIHFCNNLSYIWAQVGWQMKLYTLDENLKTHDAFFLCKMNLFGIVFTYGTKKLYVWDVSDSIHFTIS